MLMSFCVESIGKHVTYLCVYGCCCLDHFFFALFFLSFFGHSYRARSVSNAGAIVSLVNACDIKSSSLFHSHAMHMSFQYWRTYLLLYQTDWRLIRVMCVCLNSNLILGILYCVFFHSHSLFLSFTIILRHMHGFILRFTSPILFVFFFNVRLFWILY